MLLYLLQDKLVICFVRRDFRTIEEIMRKNGDAPMQEKEGTFEVKAVYHQHREKGKHLIR